jgi:hypothetical protein
VGGAAAEFGCKARVGEIPGPPEKIGFEFLRWVWSYRRKNVPRMLRILEDLPATTAVYVFGNRQELRKFMTAPLLDLGCGADADLVRHLRRCGIEAYGVDRWIPESSEYLYSASRFDYPIEDIRAGLIVSHLAFSSHLIYQQTTGGPEVERYLQGYRRILTALPPGGALVYAP